MHETDVVAQFVDAMVAAGINVDASDITADGEIHRIHVHGDHKGSKNAWYCLHYDQHPAGAFGCNKRLGKERIKWSMKGTVPLSPEERIALRKKIREAKIAKEKAEAERFARGAENANRLWEAAKPCVSHPYLQRKGVASYGLRVGAFEVVNRETGEVTVVSTQALLVPIRDKQKNILSLQAIFPNDKNPLHRDKSYLQDGKKSGLFYTIGKPKDKVVLLCEGYATGASLHAATGHAVVVAFDAGNLEDVAKVLRAGYPDYALAICADNDAWTTQPVENPGIHFATRTAKSVGGLVAVPEFVDVSTKPTDFNDLETLEGAARVAHIISVALAPPQVAAEPAPAPPAPEKPATDAPPPPKDAAASQRETGGYFALLGYDHEKFYIFQHEKKQVLIYTKGDFTESGLIALAPLHWWEMEFPAEKGGIERRSAMDWLVRGCHKAGIYDPTRIRGRGAWVDSGRSIFHHGGYLTVDSQLTQITHIRSRYVYELSHPLPDPADEILSDADGAMIIATSKMFRWAKPGSAALLAGWVALAPVCGALRWRPHIWITGGAGSGKSTVLEKFVHPLMNGIEIYAQGNSTEAGIRQTLKQDALPVLFDESESNEEKDALRMQNVLSLIRQASSESHAKTLKGTAGGDALSFHIRSMFCLASILVAIKHQADIERMTKLLLKSKREDKNFIDTWDHIKEALYKIGRDKTIPSRLFRRSLSLLPVTIKNIETFATAAAKRFGSQREGDQYGTLLAGAWSLTSQTLATPEQADAMIGGYDWSEHQEGTDEDESSRALAALLEAHIRLHGGNTVTVYELIRVALNRSVTGMMESMSALSADAVLQRYGIRIKDNRMLVSNKSEQLKKLLHGTVYEADLRGVLKRVPGADIFGNKTVRIGGTETKVVSLPLDFADDEIVAAAAPVKPWNPDLDEPPF